ncbi:substrate-binding domain-containing protein [Paenibacillus abyssi]|uniref:LacI family transcriptional regulator n=1 Tax=Paenibacillus abyssi TaxID=1340531 RepID=A0A917CZT2_9BACL|nr:substrate-binding domain-containing protein [Paenibacillus abyssi]GGG03992.1 LacI family transcriptional regulator [Paenibacillus abyssi]
MRNKLGMTFMLLMLVGLVLAGCGANGNAGNGNEAAAGGNNAAADESGGVIGVIPKSTLYDYWKSVRVGAEQAAEEAGYTIVFQGTAKDTDVEGQVKIIEDFITQGVKAIVISPTNADAMVPALEKADAAGITVIIIDGDLNSDIPHSFVSTDNVAASAMAAEKMNELIGGEGKIAVVSEVAGSIQGAAREKGFIDTMNSFGGYSLLNTFYSEGDRNLAFNITQDIFTSNPDIKGIFATNEGASIGVSLGVEASGKKDDVAVIGYDSSEDLLKAIRDGVIDGTISQDPAAIGYMGVENAIKVINGEEVEKKTDVPAVYVDNSNIDDEDIQKILYPLGKQ